MFIKIGIVEFEPDTGEKDKNLSKGLRLIEEASSKHVDILAFPELWTTGYLAGTRFTALAEKIPGPTTMLLSSSASKGRIFLVGGSIIESAGRNLYNTLFVTDRKGKIIAKHRKAHLWGDYENEYFTPGQECTVADTEFGKLGFGVCYDGDFQEYSRVLALKGATIFFNPSGYPSPDEKDWQIFYPCCARQNGFYVVCTNLIGHESGRFATRFYPQGVNFFGRSRIIDPFGNTVIQSSAEAKETALYVAEIDLSLVDKARSRPYFNLNRRRPELYGKLSAK